MGQISISVRRIYRGYEFAVSDDSPGIASQYPDRVFELFQTLTSRDKEKNIGIGPSLVKKLVKKLVESEDNSVWLDSESSQGTIFRFTWPE